jgi:hypothetical protein
MTLSYYSTVLDHSAADVWAVIRDFGHYAWAGVRGDTIVEDGKSGDAVGAVRSVRTADRHIRQRLLAHSDVERSYTYEFADSAPFPVRGYRATLRVTPVVDGGKAFVEWWASFDCAPDERERWITYFEKGGFAVWLSALRRHLDEASDDGL